MCLKIQQKILCYNSCLQRVYQRIRYFILVYNECIKEYDILLILVYNECIKEYDILLILVYNECMKEWYLNNSNLLRLPKDVCRDELGYNAVERAEVV